jgi:hypothetical protein
LALTAFSALAACAAIQDSEFGSPCAVSGASAGAGVVPATVASASCSGDCADFVTALVEAFFRGALFFSAAFLATVFLLVAFFGAAAFFLTAAFFFTGVARDLAFFGAAFLTDFLVPLSFFTFTDVFFTALLLAVLPIAAPEI